MDFMNDYLGKTMTPPKKAIVTPNEKESKALLTLANGIQGYTCTIDILMRKILEYIKDYGALSKEEKYNNLVLKNNVNKLLLQVKSAMDSIKSEFGSKDATIESSPYNFYSLIKIALFNNKMKNTLSVYDKLKKLYNEAVLPVYKQVEKKFKSLPL